MDRAPEHVAALSKELHALNPGLDVDPRPGNRPGSPARRANLSVAEPLQGSHFELEGDSPSQFEAVRPTVRTSASAVRCARDDA